MQNNLEWLLGGGLGMQARAVDLALAALELLFYNNVN